MIIENRAKSTKLAYVAKNIFILFISIFSIIWVTIIIHTATIVLRCPLPVALCAACAKPFALILISTALQPLQPLQLYR